MPFGFARQNPFNVLSVVESGRHSLGRASAVRPQSSLNIDNLGVVRAMSFRFQCPKCGTSQFSIERDQRSYAPRGQAHEMIFSCRCGKQIFGDAIEKEYDRQKAEWAANQGKDVSEVVDALKTDEERIREAALAQAYARQRRVEAESTARQSANEAAGVSPAESENADVCGWRDCVNPPRPNSKYCSRDCSNKNARSRYKKRQSKKRTTEAA